MSRWKVATSSADNIRLNTTSQYDHLKYCQWALYMFYNILHLGNTSRELETIIYYTAPGPWSLLLY